MPPGNNSFHIKQGVKARDMADEIFGDGIEVVDASYSGDVKSAGTFSGGIGGAPGILTSDSGVILSTGHVKTFKNYDKPGRPGQGNTNSQGQDGEPGFDEIAGAPTYDAAYLDVDFIPDTNLVSMSFVFASEEYPESIGTNFNDIVGIWLNGQQVEMSVASEASVSSINLTNNPDLFIDNTDGSFDTAMDGFTITLSVTLNVNPDQLNSLRVGIADVGDSALDSAILISADSISVGMVAIDDEVSITQNTTEIVDVMANDVYDGPGTLTITHINNIAVSAGSTVTLATGQVISVNADGTLSVTSDADVETVRLSYTVSDGSGTLSSAFITLDTIPCFVAGTMIRVPSGEVAVETLRSGDLVSTCDDGNQPVRWVGSRTVEAVGEGAPVKISAGALGQNDTVFVSPLHRVLIRDVVAELLFGEGEVFVAARDLINGSTIRRVEGGHVDYFHLLFDRHQIIFSGGLESESFLPGSQTTKCFEPAVIDEIRGLMPHVNPETGEGYSPAARRTLKRFEAELLLRKDNAA